MAISMGALSSPLGAIIGIALSPFFVPDDDKYDLDQAKTDIENLLWVMAIFTTVACTPLILFTR